MTFPAADTPDTRPAAFLEGKTLDGGWLVTARVEPGPGKTGGTFSVGYLAVKLDANGDPTEENGFVKAIDFSQWHLFGPDLVNALQAMTSAFQFERDLVIECASRNMRNVVRGVAHGAIEIGHGVLRSVNYIVFEVADGDIREQLDAMPAFDQAWAMRSLHNIANGVRQLHGANIFHQDIKPSNVLTFAGANKSEQSKLGDLGRAGRSGHVSPHDPLPIKGDPMYAPPECFYGFHQSEQHLDQRASDIYQLGSMVMFLFTKVGMTGNIFSRTLNVFRPPMANGTWGGTYDQVLPHLRVAFDEAIEELESAVPDQLRAHVVTTVRELCDPDPRLRGNAKAGRDLKRRYSTEFYVSRFDLLAVRAEIIFRGELM